MPHIATLEVDAILFDMDGTLVDSTAGLAGAWETFAKSYPEIDVAHILATSHGVRTVDNLIKFCGITDPITLESEAERFENAIVESASRSGGKGIVMLPGAKKLLTELSSARHLPNPLWAICTSAKRKYGSAAMGITGLPVPDVCVMAEDVQNGKPHPEPYFTGASRCGVNPEKCIVIEDSPNGIRSGKAAGCKTLAVLTSHTRVQMEAVHPDFIVDDLRSLSVELLEKGVRLTIDTA
ncbi:phosphatase [Collybia nuda]|uniref:Phosphatase n=1 Tax=Collybia nuda TaxID=64659 RepID=A0A9P5Y4W8_9AGAR|nr:phosphatase [Collybia nuda]